MFLAIANVDSPANKAYQETLHGLLCSIQVALILTYRSRENRYGHSLLVEIENNISAVVLAAIELAYNNIIQRIHPVFLRAARNGGMRR